MNNNMSKTILLVEDEAIIAISQKKALEKYGYNIITANTGERAIELVRERNIIDLILMDIDLGKGLDGPETATMILNEHDIPVVFLSSHTEPRVVEKTEKITSYGYVVKNSGITVLDASIKMAFKLFDAKEKVNSHSARNAAIIQALPDHMFVLDRSGTYLEVYSSDDTLLPIPAGEIIGKKVIELFNEEVSDKLLCLFSRCFESGELQVCEIDLMIKDRKSLYETRISRMNNENILAFVRNITEEQNAVEALRVSEEKYRLIFENSPLGLLSFDEKGVIEACNDNFVKIIGSSLESLIGLNMLNLRDANLVEALKKALNGSLGIYEGIYRSVTADKSTPVRVLFTPMNTGDGNYRGGVGIIEDITERKIAQDQIKTKNEALEALNEELNSAMEEMQAANEELETANEELVQSQKELIEYGNALDESEKKYREIYNNAIEGIFQTTPEGKLIGANPSFAAIFGFESPESIMHEVNNIGRQLYAHPEDRAHLKKLLAEQSRVVNFEVEARTRRGEAIWVSINASDLKDESGSIRGITGSIIDITKRKQAEFVLKESEKRLDLLAEQNRTIVWEIDKNGLYTYVSHVVEKILGYKPDELTGKKYFYDLCPDAERDALKSEVFSALGRRESFTGYVNSMLSADGRIVRVSTNAIPVLDVNDNLIGYRGSDTDVTEYMSAIDVLKESEARYRTLIENTGQPILVARNGFIIYANAVTSVHSGYSLDELYSMSFTEFVHPDDRNFVLDNYKRRLSGDSECISAYRFRAVSKAGKVHWLEVNAVIIDWDNSQATLNFITDYSDQVRIENELRDSELKYRKIFENVQDIFYQTDQNGIIIEISPSVERYTGFTREELIGKPVEMVYSDPGDRAEMLKIIITQGEVIDYELRLKGKDERQIITSVSSHILYDADGKPAGVEGSLRDITERKHVEEALKKSEQLHRLLTDNAKDVIWTMDLAGHFTYVSPSVEKLRGFTVEEVMQQSILESLTPESAETAMSVFKSGMEAIQAGLPVPEFRGELEQPCRDGTTVWIEATISVIYDESGEAVGIVGVSRDISDRKLIEKALRDSEELYRSILKASPDAIAITDLDGRFLMVTPSAVSMFGCQSDEDMLGHFNTEFILPEDRERAINNTALRFSGRMKGLGEYRGLRKDGSSIEIDVNGEFLRDQHGQPIKIIFIVRDITDRKLAGDRIKSLLAEKEIILKEVHHRIKNYMNTIKGLLYLQAGTTDEPVVIATLDDAARRVQSMMVLYDKLYQSVDYTNISISEYFPSLVDEIVSNFPNSDSVKIVKKIDDIALNAKKLQSLGIIINELLTNIMKYAFTGRNNGVITVSAVRNGERINMEIMDDGIGIPDSITFENPSGFGIQLVVMLVEQISGNIRIERGRGTKFILDFEI